MIEVHVISAIPERVGREAQLVVIGSRGGEEIQFRTLRRGRSAANWSKDVRSVAEPFLKFSDLTRIQSAILDLEDNWSVLEARHG